MFLLSCCVGYRQKPQFQRAVQSLERKAPLNATSTSQMSEAEAAALRCQLEAKKLENVHSSPMSRTTKSDSIGKKSTRSSVFSRYSVIGAINFCQNLMSPEPLQTMHEIPSTNQRPSLVSPPSRPTLAALNIHLKTSEIMSFHGMKAPDEAGDASHYSRPRSYSDDPFAPPTPRLPSSYSHLSHSDSCSVKSSAASSYAGQSSPDRRFSNCTVIPEQSEPCLPTIDRISKFDFSDWSTQWMNPSPLIPPLPTRQVSMTNNNTPISRSPAYRPQYPCRIDSSPNTPSLQSYCSPGTEVHQIPFPQY